MAFSHNLKRLRQARGMTQEELALACGWSGQSRVANYESSSPKAREPKLAELPVIAAALGVSLPELLGDQTALAPTQAIGHDDGGQAEPPEPAALRLDPRLLVRTHAFLAADHPYDLEDPGEAALFASAYEWLAQQDEATDSPQSFHKFLRWAAMRNLSAPTAPAGDQPKGSSTMSRWRNRLSEYADTDRELSQDPAKSAKLSTK